MTNLEWLRTADEKELIEWISKEHEEKESTSDKKDSILNYIQDYTKGKPINLNIVYTKLGLGIEVVESDVFADNLHTMRYILYDASGIRDMDAIDIVSEFAPVVINEFEEKRNEKYGYSFTKVATDSKGE